MRTIHLETTLPTSADRVWRAMQSPVTFLYVCKGLFAVPALSGRAEPLRAGERGTGWLFAFRRTRLPAAIPTPSTSMPAA